MTPRKPQGREPGSPRKNRFFAKLSEYLPSRKQLLYLPHVLSIRERYLLAVLLVIALGSFIAIPLSSYYHFTQPAAAYGGSFREGVIGTPKHINPILAATNDVDRDITSLVYSGLLRRDDQGNLINDLAQSYTISSDGLSYTFILRDNAKWQDGQPVTADDVIFTVLTAQNGDYGNTELVQWQGVTVTKKDDHTVIFTLHNKYAQFLNSMTLGILPKHIWSTVTTEQFNTSDFNLKPIGSGPYRFSKIVRNGQGIVKSYELTSFDKYYGGRAHIAKIIFVFYPSEDELIQGYNSGAIDNISSISTQKLSSLHLSGKLKIHELKLPRYFAVFFNQSTNKALTDKNVRLALTYGTDRQQIIKDVLAGHAVAIDSPMMPGIIQINPLNSSRSFDPDKANSLLDDAQWLRSGSGTRQKTSVSESSSKTKKKPTAESTDLSIELTTSNWPDLVSAANEIKKQWENLGVHVDLRILSLPELQRAIKNRDYQALLFGEVLNLDPDPFSFWHSTQRKDPGLNLALYANKDADQLLEDARQTLDDSERISKYAKLQELIARDVPAIFLYSPSYIYAQSVAIQGNSSQIINTPADRFSTIGQWYISVARQWGKGAKK